MESEEICPRTTVDPNPIKGGILCPNCGCAHHEVTHSIPSETNFWKVRKQYIRRRRMCLRCGCPFHTREVVEPEIPKVINSPAAAKRLDEVVKDLLSNTLPLKDGETLPNPFLPEK